MIINGTKTEATNNINDKQQRKRPSPMVYELRYKLPQRESHDDKRSHGAGL